MLEGEDGSACLFDGDCHLIVLRGRKLYEMWRANLMGATFLGGCLAVWDLDGVYAPSGRGENCTSADAAGYPIAPLLLYADEVADDRVNHAIRFIIPNDRIREGEYVHPATDATRATSGGPNSVPYGARLRLRPDCDLESLPAGGARAVAKALMRYGMFLADGGHMTLTAASDRHASAKWEGMLGPRDLAGIAPSDFEVIEAGDPIPYTGDCRRESAP